MPGEALFSLPGAGVLAELFEAALGEVSTLLPEAEVDAAPLPLLVCDSSADLLCIELHAAREAAHANAISHLDIDFS